MDLCIAGPRSSRFASCPHPDGKRRGPTGRQSSPLHRQVQPMGGPAACPERQWPGCPSRRSQATRQQEGAGARILEAMAIFVGRCWPDRDLRSFPTTRMTLWLARRAFAALENSPWGPRIRHSSNIGQARHSRKPQSELSSIAPDLQGEDAAAARQPARRERCITRQSWRHREPLRGQDHAMTSRGFDTCVLGHKARSAI
jgi:hypothetical protein